MMATNQTMVHFSPDLDKQSRLPWRLMSSLDSRTFSLTPKSKWSQNGQKQKIKKWIIVARQKNYQ
jgi:hypothetical protein